MLDGGPAKAYPSDCEHLRKALLSAPCREHLMEYLTTVFPRIRYHDLEECLQDALLAANRGLSQYRMAFDGSFYKWVQRIARNATIDWLRQQPQVRPLSLSSQFDVPASEGRKQRPRLKKHLFPVRLFLEQLPQRERDAITLVDVCELSIREAAERLGVTYNACVQARHRAHEKLHTLVREYPEILRPWVRK